MKTTRKLGENRGKRRLWLQGEILAAAGFVPGDRYDAVCVGQPQSPRGCITMIKRGEGARKISGKGTMPIADMIGAVIATTFPAGVVEVNVSANLEAGTIVIRGKAVVS